MKFYVKNVKRKPKFFFQNVKKMKIKVTNKNISIKYKVTLTNAFFSLLTKCRRIDPKMGHYKKILFTHICNYGFYSRW